MMLVPLIIFYPLPSASAVIELFFFFFYFGESEFSHAMS